MFDQEQENLFPYLIKFILMMKIEILAAMIRIRTLNDDHALPFQARPRLLFIQIYYNRDKDIEGR